MEEIWWERVPNAIAFTSDVVQSLLEEKSIIVQCRRCLPWRDTWVKLVRDEVTQNNSIKRFEMVGDVDDPGQYLWKHFCNLEKRLQYRPSKTYARFLAESDDIVLNSLYLWVRIDSEHMLEQWADFVSEYARVKDKTKESAVFILEWSGTTQIRSKKGLWCFDLDLSVGQYDRLVFATLAASTVQILPMTKYYLTELAANVVGDDVELCAECIDRHQEFLNNPYGTIQDIVENSCRSDFSEFDFTMSEQDVERLIWRAQIKSIYPVIEEFRLSFVSGHEKEIRRELPMESAYGEIYEEPEDVELAALRYMVKGGKLYLKPEEYTKLCAFWNARNKLSHLSSLTMEEIQQLCL